ncbi:MAG: hypothetical protein A3I66_21745 [Burkholderiales bacterium RIFCSPLOWO2_02_FULL_57_36]|nr:MAG: hypothetical protein A3I66_21745 [Burkholderiales bacterium RIFCSPLOWO2_02_FULL_57_36]
MEKRASHRDGAKFPFNLMIAPKVRIKYFVHNFGAKNIASKKFLKSSKKRCSCVKKAQFIRQRG